MELFLQLGRSIEARWLAANYNEDDLPAIAADELKRADIPSKISVWDVVAWTLDQFELPPQRDLHASFGDPPITIFSGPRFFIDVYFWFDGTTAIHQHGFCGAFQVMAGSSIHSWYDFERREKINTFCEIGDIKLRSCDLLAVGDVQEIWGGRRYIHSLFHLEQPSVTIVVRTDRSPLDLPQFAYEKPSLARDPFFEQATTTKKIQAMSALVRAKRPETEDLIAKWLETSDLQTSFSILSRLRGLLRSDHLQQLFKLEDPRSRLERFFDIVGKRHGAAGETFRAIFERLDMHDDIVARRSYVSDPEHRFFMALLLNLDDREHILRLIKKRYPDADPIEKVLDWTFDLAQTRVVGIEASNALGIPDFGDAEMFVLENLLKGVPDDEIVRSYAAENAGADEPANAALGKIRDSVFFRPLLV